jgi:hypothetical protein
MSVDTRVRYASLAIWVAYLLMPTDVGGLLRGVPLGPFDAAALLALAWVVAHRRRLPAAPVLAIVIVATALTTFALPGKRGFNARYYANAAATGAHERSTDFSDAAITRIDSRLDFVPGSRELPVVFFNDNSRFNFYQANQPHRRRLEFAVAWTGWWWVERGEHTLYLETPQSVAQISIDNEPMLSATPDSGFTTTSVTLERGWHRLHVQYSSPYAASRQFSAGEIVNGKRQPFDGSTVMTRRIEEWQHTALWLAGAVKIAIDAAVLAWLAWAAGMALLSRVRASEAAGVDREVQAYWLFAAAGAVEAWRFAWPWAGQVMLLTGGDDPLTYEGYARDILLNGILMNGGAALGAGEPFYYQAFYPYFLAAAHRLFGEGMYGVMLLQRGLCVVMILLMTRIATGLGGRPVWPVALAGATLFTWWKFAPLAAGLANESLYVPLLVAWVASLVRSGAAPGVAAASRIGLLAGLTAITRSTALLSWAVLWPPLALRWWRLGHRRALVAMIAVSLAVFSLIAIRNALVAHTFAPTSTELGVTLRGGNEPPPGMVLDISKRAGFYQRFGIGDFTAEVIEFAITAPGTFAANLGRKALFALGFYEPYAPGWGYSPVYIAVWTGAIGGLILALKAGHQPAVIVLVPVLVALTQFVAVVIVYPKGERLIIPVHALLLPYATIALAALVRRLRSSRPAAA